jgi:hypothetical protein
MLFDSHSVVVAGRKWKVVAKNMFVVQRRHLWPKTAELRHNSDTILSCITLRLNFNEVGCEMK